MAFQVTGITRDNTGNLVGSVEVYLMKYNSTTHLFTQVARTTSDPTTGSFAFTSLADNDPAYNIVAFKDGTPHSFDISDRNLTPRPSAGSAVDPLTQFGSNLINWCDGNVAASIFNPTPAQAANGEDVDRWDDASASDLDQISEPGAPSRPTLNTTGFNGGPCVVFNGSAGQAMRLESTNTIGTSDGIMAVFIAFSMDLSTTPSNGRILSWLDNDDSNDATSDVSFLFSREGTTNALMVYRNGQQTGAGAIPIATNTPYRAAIIYTGAVLKFYIGSSTTPMAQVGADITDTRVFGGAGGLWLCRQFSANNFGMDGKIAGYFMVKNAAPTPTDIANVDAWMIQEYF